MWNEMLIINLMDVLVIPPNFGFLKWVTMCYIKKINTIPIVDLPFYGAVALILILLTRHLFSFVFSVLKSVDSVLRSPLFGTLFRKLRDQMKLMLSVFHGHHLAFCAFSFFSVRNVLLYNCFWWLDLDSCWRILFYFILKSHFVCQWPLPPSRGHRSPATAEIEQFGNRGALWANLKKFFNPNVLIPRTSTGFSSVTTQAHFSGLPWSCLAAGSCGPCHCARVCWWAGSACPGWLGTPGRAAWPRGRPAWPPAEPRTTAAVSGGKKKRGRGGRRPKGATWINEYRSGRTNKKEEEVG